MEENKKPSINVKEVDKPRFFEKDAKDIGTFLWKDKIIPGIKKFTYDIFINGLHMALFGSGSSSSSSGVTDYAKPYQRVSFGNLEQNRPVQRPAQQSNNMDFSRFVFDTRGDAEAALLQLSDIISEYGVARVSDFYDILQKTPPVTAHNYGWGSVVDAKVKPCSDGFIIEFPPIKIIK